MSLLPLSLEELFSSVTIARLELKAAQSVPQSALLYGVLGATCTAACYLLSSAASPRLTPAYAKLSAADKRDWNGRTGHIVHALIVTFAVGATLWTCPDFRKPLPPWGQPTSLHAVSTGSFATFGFSLGYFVADTVLMLCLQTQALGLMLVHHLGGIVALAAVLLNNECHLYGLVLLATEITTPFINLRWMMDKVELKRSNVYVVNGVSLVVSWVVIRIVGFLFLFQHMWTHRKVMSTFALKTQVVAPAITVALFVMNVFWFYKICRGVVRLVAGKQKLL